MQSVRRWASSLTAQTFLWLTIALLPLGAVSIWQTQRLAAQALDQRQSDLVALTELAVNPLRAQLEQGFGALGTLVPAVLRARDDPAACSSVLRDFVARDDLYDLALFVPVSGYVDCRSAGDPVDLSRNPRLHRAIAEPSFFVTRTTAEMSQMDHVILNLSAPVRETSGKLAGFLTISLPEQKFVTARGTSDLSAGLSVALFNRYGELLVANVPDAVVPGLFALNADWSPTISEAPGLVEELHLGEVDRTVVTVPVKAGVVYALGTFAQPAPMGLPSLSGSALFPILMWLTSAMVALLALERLVLRPVRSLNTSIRQFDLHRTQILPPSGARAPTELGELERSIRGLSEAVVQEQARIAANLEAKNILLQEVHHRVKNNLQLINSMINMQIRNLDTPDAIPPLRRMQDRVLGLASVYRILYQDERIANVDAGRMIEALLRDVLHAAPSLEVRTDISPTSLTPDDAVAFSLCLSEILIEIGILVRDFASNSQLEVSFGPNPGNEGHRLFILLAVPSNHPPLPRAWDPLGQKLIESFAKQLGGTVARTNETDSIRIELVFPLETR